MSDRRAGGTPPAVLPAVLVAVVVAAAGAPLGWLWAALAPEVPVRKVDGGIAPVDTQPEQFFAADGWFMLLGTCFGLLAATGVWFLARRCRGPVGLVALAAGAVGAGLLAWWLGHRVGLAGYQAGVRTAEVGAALDRPPDLRARELGWWLGFIPRIQGNLLVPALAATIGYTMLAAWSRYPSLTREVEVTEAAEVGQPEPQLELGGPAASSDSGTGTART